MVDVRVEDVLGVLGPVADESGDGILEFATVAEPVDRSLDDGEPVGHVVEDQTGHGRIEAVHPISISREGRNAHMG